ncbi:glycolate oxidase subunit GlcF [Luteimonas pelagia]
MPEAAPRSADRPAAGAPGRIVALDDQCVQCGLCLPACPTYGLDRLEAESPRGRIALARAWALDTVPPTPAGDAHLDNCLGCRRCEAVCPAGVRYGPLLVEARAAQRARRSAGLRQRLVEWLVARRGTLNVLLEVYRRAWPWLPMPWRPLPRPPRRPAGDAGARHATSGGTALFVGCVADAYEASLRAAVATLCARAGVGLDIPVGQRCCGALHAHAGDMASAATLASANAATFEGAAAVLTLATGCHDAVAGALPAGRAIDAARFLAGRADAIAFAPRHERVALHLPCTQRSVARSDAATRELLARVPGLEVVELDADPATRGFGCCGAAGSTMLADPDRAAEFRAPLLAQLRASGATRLLSANIGCRLHLANGTPLPVLHPLEFLADCLAAPGARAG